MSPLVQMTYADALLTRVRQVPTDKQAQVICTVLISLCERFGVLPEELETKETIKARLTAIDSARDWEVK